MSENTSDRRIIGKVVVDPLEVLPADTVLVEVLAPSGHSYDNAELPYISINGVTGSKQYLQFARPGEHKILVVARKGNTVERAASSVTVLDPADIVPEGGPPEPGKAKTQLHPEDLPLLHVAAFHDAPYRVAFSVGGTAIFDRGHSRRRPLRCESGDLAPSPLDELHRANEWRGVVPGLEELEDSPELSDATASGYRSVIVRQGKRKSVPATAHLLRKSGTEIIGHAGLLEAGPASPLSAAKIKERRGEMPIYHWDFGDGHQQSTYGTRVEHDYSGSLDPARQHQQFQVTCRIENQDGSVREQKRTLTLFNAYAMCKRLGVVAPPTEHAWFAELTECGFSAHLRVTNLEDVPLNLTHTRVRVLLDRPDHWSPLGPVEPADPPIIIGAKETFTIPVALPFSRVPKTAIGFSIHFLGSAADKKPVRLEGTFDIPAQSRSVGALASHEPAADPDQHSDRIPAACLPLHEGIGELSLDAMDRMALGPDIERIRGLVRSLTSSAYLYSADFPVPLVEGAECDPENLPQLTDAQINEGWACQMTTESVEVETPARFLNALKGDIVLSPGGDDLVGQLLRHVTPPQYYGHCGMMTHNHDQVTHSTASMERVFDHPKGSILGMPAPLEGFVPEVLKYLWPGVVTQSVEDAVHGEARSAPDTGKPYTIRAFSAGPRGWLVDGQWEIVPPLVVKPDPVFETPAIRLKLMEVADDALAQTGLSHYRLYCFTDPTICQDPANAAPVDAGWAAGTFPSGCSAFLWMLLKKHQVQLEGTGPTVSPGDLEATDTLAGAEVVAGCPDGLYCYRAAERVAAGDWLVEEIARMTKRQLEGYVNIFGPLLDSLTHMSEHIINQIMNSFASDWTDTGSANSDDWHGQQNIHDTFSVSPQDILCWDPPYTGGVYGFTVPLAYRSRRMETLPVHRWTRVSTRGTLNGHVSFKGAPVEGALVQVYEGKSDVTDTDGFYEITDIPLGKYVLKAFKDDIDGFPASKNIEAELNQPMTVQDIGLDQPSLEYRRVQIKAQVATTDVEWGPDEHASTAYFREVQVAPAESHADVYFEQRMGGEIRIELRFQVDLGLDGVVKIAANAKMFQGATESTTDLDDEENALPFEVAKEQQQSGWIHLYNNEFFGGDTCQISFTVVNLAQP